MKILTIALFFIIAPTTHLGAKKSLDKPTMSGHKIMEKVDQNNKRLKTMSSEVLMTIVRGKDKRERNFYHLKKYQNNVTKSLIKFYLPATVKGTSLLTHSPDGKTSKNQWIYLPAIKTLTQITGDRENDSFMGSDFTYSDVAGRQLNQDTHTLIKETKSHYLVRSNPKDKTDIYSKIILNVSKKNFVPNAISFYGKNGKVIKQLKNKIIKKFGSAYIVTDATMKSDKGQTHLLVSEIDIDKPISDKEVGIKGIRR